MTALPRGYDAWRLSCPYDDFDGVGEEEGYLCNRVEEPDEDAPRGYRPKPCQGEMIESDGVIVCDTCGETA